MLMLCADAPDCVLVGYRDAGPMIDRSVAQPEKANISVGSQIWIVDLVKFFQNFLIFGCLTVRSVLWA